MFPNPVEFMTACRAHALYHGTERGISASLSCDSRLEGLLLLDQDGSVASVPSIGLLPPLSTASAISGGGGGGSMLSISHLEDMQMSPSEELEHALSPPNLRGAVSALLRGAKVREQRQN